MCAVLWVVPGRMVLLRVLFGPAAAHHRLHGLRAYGAGGGAALVALPHAGPQHRLGRRVHLMLRRRTRAVVDTLTGEMTTYSASTVVNVHREGLYLFVNKKIKDYEKKRTYLSPLIL